MSVKNTLEAKTSRVPHVASTACERDEDDMRSRASRERKEATGSEVLFEKQNAPGRLLHTEGDAPTRDELKVGIRTMLPHH